MSRIIIPCTDKNGNKVFFETSEHEGKELVENYEGYVIFLQKNDFRPLKEKANPAKKSTPEPKKKQSSDEGPLGTQHCSQCGEKMAYREGFSKKTNKPWKAYFCPNDHDPKWV